MDADATAATWKGLAESYEAARTRPDSFDVLMEFPAQLELIGDVAGKRVLDLACGSGAKAIHLARQGAREVVGVDISETFVRDVARLDPPPTTRFLHGDISRLDDIQGLSGRFDVVLLLNALGYADDELVTLRAIRALIEDEGAFILARAHPVRFAVERSESTGVELGAAYHDRSPFSYTSSWDGRTTLTHRAATFGDTVNRVVEAGFWVERVVEPTLTEEQRREFPHKAAWIDRYVGTLMVRARPRRG
jgi:SAM-dependent methyltransferase